MMKKMDWVAVVVDDNDHEEWVLMKWVKKKSLEVVREKKAKIHACSFLFLFLFNFNFFSSDFLNF